MKPNDFLTEQQLDELDLQKTKDAAGKVVRGAAKGLGAVGKGIGAVAGVPQGMARAAKKGYNASVNAIGGDEQAATSSPEAAKIQQQIQQKKSEIQGLEQQLTQVQQGTDAPATQPTNTSTVGDKVGKAASAISNAITGAADAAKFGKGMGAAGQSLMKPSVSDPNTYNVQDRFGRTLSYKKVGDKWFDQQGNPVDDNFAASIEQAKKTAPAGDVNKQPAATPDEMGRIEPTMNIPAAQPATTAPTKGAVGSQFVGGVPATNTAMPSNMATYPPKTTDTTQAILPQPTATRQAVNPKFVGGVPQVGGKLPAASPTMPQAATQPVATPAAAPKQTKVTTGGPTPAEKANLQKRIQAAQAQQPVAEGKNFAGILWQQMKADK